MPIQGRTFQKDEKEIRILMDVAQGKKKASLAVVNARLMNVYTGEYQEEMSVCVRGKWIAYVGTEPEPIIGKETEVIDAGGKTVIPGLIDGHTHLIQLFHPGEFLKYAIKGGTTTIVTETLEAFPIMGLEGVREILRAFKNQPVKIFATAPPMISISKASHGIEDEQLIELLKEDEVVGLGESYWQSVLQEPDHIISKYTAALNRGKTLEGHTAGARKHKLNAYIAAGISSCHEPITAQEVLDRLRLGLYIMIREGSIRRDLKAISDIGQSGADLRRLVLSTDGISPRDLLEKGYMEYVVQKAIQSGFEPITAVRMATLNVAEHFGLDDIVGGVAPGKYADFLILPDPETIAPETVVSMGRVAALNGKCLAEPRWHEFPQNCKNTVDLGRKFVSEDFSIRMEGENQKEQVRLMEMVTDLVTRETIIDIPVKEGEIGIDLSRDIVKVAAVDRVNNPGETFVGLIRGFTFKHPRGAFAASTSWDTSDIVVVGADDSDMACAVNRIHELQGGIVVCSGGEILAELALPIMGLISELVMSKLAQKIDEVREAAFVLGISFEDPILTLSTLTGAAIPYLRICEEGLVNLKVGKTLGLIV